jgi:cell division protein FtsL
MLRFVNVCLVIAVAAGACGLYVLKTDTRRLEAFVQSQERTRDRLVDDIAVLKAERAHLSRPERLEVAARALGLQPLDAKQLIRLDELKFQLDLQRVSPPRDQPTLPWTTPAGRVAAPTASAP